jgi:DNA-binding transcriptional MocR family regulator
MSLTARELADEIDDRSARGIAAALGRLISAGQLSEGTRLPTVRDLSKQLGVSPTTVSEAWQSLAGVGAIDARGRHGTFVTRPSGPGAPRRYRRVTSGAAHVELDLSTGTPDPSLLPDLGPVVARVSRQSLTSSYLDQPVLPQLEEHLRSAWPFTPDEITVVDGAMDALDRVAQVVVRLGDRVVVEHPTFPPLLDLLDLLGADLLPVDLDDEGPQPDQLAAALAADPAAVFLQPRAHNPTGVTMTALRARRLADLLRPHRAVIVEDDHSGDIANGALVSLGRWLPDRTVHLRSYSKSHGPDLRLAAVGGAGDIVATVANRRLLGPGWSSRILQAVLLELLTHASPQQQVATARAEYARRRAALADALAERGVTTAGTDGINLWVPVDDERAALVALAAQGIGVAPGDPFQVRPDRPAVRVTAGLVPEGAGHLAAALVAAGGDTRPGRRAR